MEFSARNFGGTEGNWRGGGYGPPAADECSKQNSGSPKPPDPSSNDPIADWLSRTPSDQEIPMADDNQSDSGYCGDLAFGDPSHQLPLTAAEHVQSVETSLSHLARTQENAKNRVPPLQPPLPVMPPQHSSLGSISGN